MIVLPHFLVCIACGVCECVCMCACHCLGAEKCGGRERMIDGGRLNGEVLRLSSCKLVRTDAITLTEDTRPSITFTWSSRVLHIQMGTVCVL